MDGSSEAFSGEPLKNTDGNAGFLCNVCLLVYCSQVVLVKVFPALMTFEAESSLCGEGPAFCCHVVTWAQPSTAAAAVGRAGHTPGQRRAVSCCAEGVLGLRGPSSEGAPWTLQQGRAHALSHSHSHADLVTQRLRPHEEPALRSIHTPERSGETGAVSSQPLSSPPALDSHSQLLAHTSLTLEPPPPTPTSSRGTRSVPTPVSSLWRRPHPYGMLAFPCELGATPGPLVSGWSAPCTPHVQKENSFNDHCPDLWGTTWRTHGLRLQSVSPGSGNQRSATRAGDVTVTASPNPETLDVGSQPA